jgi:Etoposide-induced protein 2.4 (EI24)
MKSIADAFWRSVAYCLHPKVMRLSLVPLVLMSAMIGAMAYFFWESAMGYVWTALESSDLVSSALTWLESAGVGQLKTVLAPLIVIAVATPVIVVLSLLVVSLMITPIVVNLLSQQRFLTLERLNGASFWGSLAWSLSSTVLALFAMVASAPLWLIPPLILVLPPLIWGWLTYRVMAFDALAAHASPQERKILFTRHRFGLMGMGVMAGYLGAAPSLIWSIGIWAIVWAPFLIPLSIWLYTLIFTFCSLWFSHYCLHTLQQLRLEQTTKGEAVVITSTAMSRS